MTTTQCVTAAETQDVRLHVEGNVPSNRGILTGRMRRLETRVTQMQMNECVVPYPCKRLSCVIAVKIPEHLKLKSLRFASFLSKSKCCSCWPGNFSRITVIVSLEKCLVVVRICHFLSLGLQIMTYQAPLALPPK